MVGPGVGGGLREAIAAGGGGGGDGWGGEGGSLGGSSRPSPPRIMARTKAIRHPLATQNWPITVNIGKNRRATMGSPSMNLFFLGRSFFTAIYYCTMTHGMTTLDGSAIPIVQYGHIGSVSTQSFSVEYYCTSSSKEHMAYTIRSFEHTTCVATGMATGRTFRSYNVLERKNHLCSMFEIINHLSCDTIFLRLG